jgi:hypothetical protein
MSALWEISSPVIRGRLLGERREGIEHIINGWLNLIMEYGASDRFIRGLNADLSDYNYYVSGIIPE